MRSLPAQMFCEILSVFRTPFINALNMSKSTKSARKNGKNSGPGSKAKKPKMASLADRHRLYQEAVQCVESEIDFVDETFKTLRRRKAKVLREDFAGTANTACEWVRRRSSNHAVAIDLDPEVLDWGREHNVKPLGEAAERISLRQENVLDAQTGPVDIVLAHNFSYWLFKERSSLRRYFETIRGTLMEDGLFFLDAYGGSEAYTETTDKTKNKGFTYLWEQASYNPVTGDMTCHIHFRFPDGSKMRRAFSYQWRLWSLPEIRELLAEAGFSRSSVYWEGTDEETGEGDGEFSPTEVGEADPAWVAYVVAEP